MKKLFLSRVMRALVAALGILGVSTHASAAAWSPMSPIKVLQITPTAIYVQLDTTISGMTNINGCTAFGGYFVIYTGGSSLNSFQNAMASTLIGLKLANKQVQIYSISCSAIGYNNADYIATQP